MHKNILRTLIASFIGLLVILACLPPAAATQSPVQQANTPIPATNTPIPVTTSTPIPVTTLSSSTATTADEPCNPVHEGGIVEVGWVVFITKWNETEATTLDNLETETTILPFTYYASVLYFYDRIQVTQNEYAPKAAEFDAYYFPQTTCDRNSVSDWIYLQGYQELSYESMTMLVKLR